MDYAQLKVFSFSYPLPFLVCFSKIAWVLSFEEERDQILQLSFHHFCQFERVQIRSYDIE